MNDAETKKTLIWLSRKYLLIFGITMWRIQTTGEIQTVLLFSISSELFQAAQAGRLTKENENSDMRPRTTHLNTRNEDTQTYQLQQSRLCLNAVTTYLHCFLKYWWHINLFFYCSKMFTWIFHRINDWIKWNEIIRLPAFVVLLFNNLFILTKLSFRWIISCDWI